MKPLTMRAMNNAASNVTLIHPPGGLPQGAPRGLVDVWMTTQPPVAEQAREALVNAVQTHGLSMAIWSVLLFILVWVGIWFWRDWRGHVLRWQIRRMQSLLARDSQRIPEPIGAALMWALARYFRMRPAVDRRALPPEWQRLVAALDALRFGPAAPVAAWSALLDELSAGTRNKPVKPSAVPQASSS